ncbi:MAG: drug/metabolite transporter (DMT)-like permease [Granulosicoccus sp.]|jgi:drug/metabolite transporter (DMT)-like permease
MPNNQSPFTDTTRGMFWMLMTGLCFVAVTILVRYIGTRIPAPEAAFIRYAFGTLFLLPVIIQLFTGVAKIHSWRIMLVRGVLHGIGVILWFYAMARIPIAEVTALGYITPVFITIGAALFLGEKLHIRRILAVLFGLVGVIIILRPGLSEISSGQIAQLVAAPLFAASMLMTKKMTSTESLAVIVTGLSIVCTLTLLLPALGNWVAPNTTEIALLALTAVFATLGHYTMTKAFNLAPLSVLQPISFLQLLWATIFGVILFGESIDIFVVIGGAVLVISTSYIAYRESVANATQAIRNDTAA